MTRPGDGTTTGDSCWAQGDRSREGIEGGSSAGMNPMDLKRGVDKARDGPLVEELKEEGPGRFTTQRGNRGRSATDSSSNGGR